LRIGYVSADFREHASAFFLMPLLGNHDRREFEITCYANVPAPDATTERFVSLVDRWRNIVGVSDEQVAVDVRADQIDILVDLKLHTSDNRLLIFARKPAPIQVSWLGYPGSSGLKTIDYRLTDSYLEPAGGANLFADHPYRLPDCFWCYDPLEDRPAVNSLPAIAAGYVTFGSLNNFFKVTDATLDLWAKVLLENADSRLLLLAPAGSARERTLEKLSRRGVDSGRVEFVARQSRQEYLRTYHRIDVCLDTIPYNGHTTSLDALFMGVPVLTRVGNSPVGRGGWTQLSNLGLQELAALDDGEFVRLAAGLAGDLPRLEKLRGILRGRMEESRLMDGPRFARGVEAAYRDVWQLYCKSGL
jgi:predicted O-linked N-acetylglucosamine transferase (SPINDLY family)